MRVNSNGIGLSLVVAGLLLVGCDDVTNIYIEENRTDGNLSVENLIVENLTVKNLTVDDEEDEEKDDDSLDEENDDDDKNDDDESNDDNKSEGVEDSEEDDSKSSAIVEERDFGIITPSISTIPIVPAIDTSKKENVVIGSGDVVVTPIIPKEEEADKESGDNGSSENVGQTSSSQTTPTLPKESEDNGSSDNESGDSDSTGEVGQTPAENSTTPIEPTEDKVEPIADTLAMSVIGSVVDGIIYGGRVSIYDLNKKLLGSGTTNAKGAYSIPIAKLPKQYKVEVKGGRDSGVDGVENSNDRDSSFAMSAIVDREDDGEESVAHISPATTLVSSMVEDGKIPLDDARFQVDEALGLDGKSPLCKLNPTKNDVAYRAGLFLAMVIESIHITDKNSLFKTLSKVVIEKKIKIKISNVGVNIEKLDLVDIATRANVDEKEIAKLAKVEVIVKETIKSSIESVAVVEGISSSSQNEALAQRAGWDRLLDTIDKNDEVDVDRLSMVMSRLQQSIREILSDQGLEASEPSNIALIADVINENLDKDIDSISSSLVKISIKYTKHIKIIDETSSFSSKKSLKSLIARLYVNSNIDSVDDIDALLDSDGAMEQLDESAKAIDEKVEAEENSQEIRDELIDAIAGGVASRVESGIIPIDGDTSTAIKDFADMALGDEGLFESIKSVVKIKIKIKSKKTRLTKRDRAELRASIKVSKDIKITIKTKGYTKIDSSASSDMLEYITSMLESLNDDAYQEKIYALEMSLANLSKAFDKVKYQAKVEQSVKIVQKIKVKTTTNIIKTIVKIKIVIKYKFIKNPNDSVIADIDDNIGDYEVGDDKPKRVIILPQPMLDSMNGVEKIRFEI